MIPPLYLLLCLISGYAIVRLGQVVDKLEAAQLERLRAAMTLEPVMPSGRRFASDLLGGVALTILFLACLVLAFGIAA